MAPRTTWGSPREGQTVIIETGRDQSVEVPAGSPFVETVEKAAGDANYWGYYRVFLNGTEVCDPSNAPDTIEPGMRVQITSYDKVGC